MRWLPLVEDSSLDWLLLALLDLQSHDNAVLEMASRENTLFRVRQIDQGRATSGCVDLPLPMFHWVDRWVCQECEHFSKPECGPDCDFCRAVDESDLRFDADSPSE
jgi:hypothetical protein